MEFRRIKLQSPRVGESTINLTYGVVWRMFVLFIAASILIALSFKQPWLQSLDEPEVTLFDTAKMTLVTPDTKSLITRDVSLPDQWHAGLPRTFHKTYQFNFERTADSGPLAFFVPFAQDAVLFRINGQKLAAHRYTEGRTSWLWNRPLLYRFPDSLLNSHSNLVEIVVQSTGSTRIALGKVYLGPMHIMDDLYSNLWNIKVGVPMAGCVFMVVSALAFLAYAPVGGVLFWISALFNLSAGISMLNWLLVTPPMSLHVWYAFVTFCEYMALIFMSLFMGLYLKVQQWLLVALGLFTVPIMLLALAAMFGADMDSTHSILENAEVAWAIGGLLLFAVSMWRYCIHDDLNDQAILWGVVLLIAFGLRDSAVHLGMVPLSKGLYIPVGHLIVALSMVFVFLRSAIQYSTELDNYRKELGGRFNRHAAEIQEITAKQSELELMAIVGRLSQNYSHELRNPVGACLASGNLALKQIEPEYEKLRAEAKTIVSSSLVCGDLLGQMLATEKGLFPADSRVQLLMPEWLIARSEDLSTAIGARVTVGESVSVKISAQPRSLLQAIGLVLSDICDQHPQGCTVSAVVSCIEDRAQMMFFFSRPMPVDSEGGMPNWTASMASAQALLSVDNAKLEVLYDAEGFAIVCLIEAQTVASLGDSSAKVSV